MSLLATVARYEIGIILAAFAAVIAFQFLTGRIKTQGLLSDKTQGSGGAISPGRVQLLLVTFAMAFYVLSELIKTNAFPIIETKWLMILAGSHSVFLSGKGVLSLLTSQIKEP